MIYRRLLYDNLIEWKNSKWRKPLVLRGARQVGKTTLVRDFAQNYKHHIFLNLEKKADRYFFETFDEVKELTDAIFLSKSIPPDYAETLLFIDEIQESPEAIALLRYFYEELPELHIIASGSLLEFAFKDVKTFPVGRVEYRYLGAFSFEEFLLAQNQGQLIEEWNKIPVQKVAHKTLLDQFNRYLIIGGMPEIIKKYISTRSLASLTSTYESIWQSYKDDIEKYGRNNTERKILRHLINTAPNYLDQRITFQNFGNSTYRSREVKEAFLALDKAKVIRMVYPSSDTRSPALPYYNKSPRLQFIDTGLINYTLSIQAHLMALSDLSDAYRGAVVPHMLFQELISKNTSNDEMPHFWVRDKKQSQAELDLIHPFENKLIPVEIKSGKKGTLRSLHQFIEISGVKHAVRFYGAEFSIEEAKTSDGTPFKLLNLPYYLVGKLDEYLSYFVDKQLPNI